MTGPKAVSDSRSPGAQLVAMLNDHGWTQVVLAGIIDRPVQLISDIATGRKEITRETAVQFAAAFGTTPEFWLEMQNDYKLSQLCADPAFQDRIDEIKTRVVAYIDDVPDMVHAELAARLRIRMNHPARTKPLTQAALAAAAGCTQKHLSQVLSGKASATTGTWSKLLAAAAVPTAEDVEPEEEPE